MPEVSAPLLVTPGPGRSDLDAPWMLWAWSKPDPAGDGSRHVVQGNLARSDSTRPLPTQVTGSWRGSPAFLAATVWAVWEQSVGASGIATLELACCL